MYRQLLSPHSREWEAATEAPGPRACAPQQEKHGSEKPVSRSEGEPQLAAPGERPDSNEDPGQPKI